MFQLSDGEVFTRGTPRIRVDRAVTTLGFEKHTSPHDIDVWRPRADTLSSRGQRTSRAITAPLLSNRTLTSSVVTTRGQEVSLNDKPSQKITPDVLIKLLTDRGLGSPRMSRYPPLPPEHVTDLHYAGRRKITYYMEKLKGRSRMDYDLANTRAMAFCEEQREASHVHMRTGSALFRSRNNRQQPATRFNGDERSFIGV